MVFSSDLSRYIKMTVDARLSGSRVVRCYLAPLLFRDLNTNMIVAVPTPLGKGLKSSVPAKWKSCSLLPAAASLWWHQLLVW